MVSNDVQQKEINASETVMEAIFVDCYHPVTIWVKNIGAQKAYVHLREGNALSATELNFADCPMTAAYELDVGDAVLLLSSSSATHVVLTANTDEGEASEVKWQAMWPGHR